MSAAAVRRADGKLAAAIREEMERRKRMSQSPWEPSESGETLCLLPGAKPEHSVVNCPRCLMGDTDGAPHKKP